MNAAWVNPNLSVRAVSYEAMGLSLSLSNTPVPEGTAVDGTEGQRWNS